MTEQLATHIMRDERIMGGKPRIDGYRISVHDVAIWTQQGQSPETIATLFPLTLGQIHAALAYYYDHKDEIDCELERDDVEFKRLAAEASTSHLTKRIRDLMEERRVQLNE